MPTSRIAADQASKDEQARRARLANQRHRQIDDLMKQAMKFDQNQQLKEAADTLRHLLVIDPNNDVAKLTLKIINDKITYRAWQSIVDDRSRETQRLMVDNPST